MSKHTLVLLKLAVAAELFFVVADAYVAGNVARVGPTLADFTAAQQGTAVDVRLDLGEERNGPRLVLNGLGLEFLGDEVGDVRVAPPLLSVKTGPLARATSSPLYGLRKTRDPSHIDLTGARTVAVSRCCWRLFFEEGAPSGSVVCGFHLPEETEYRNGASLSSCDAYITFNVWGGGDLATLREKKERQRRSAARQRQESAALAERTRSATGALEWASRYRSALVALEKSWNASRAEKGRFDRIPGEGDTLRIGDDLFLSRKGMVWTGARRGGRFRHKTLGTAFASLSVADGF